MKEIGNLCGGNMGSFGVYNRGIPPWFIVLGEMIG